MADGAVCSRFGPTTDSQHPLNHDIMSINPMFSEPSWFIPMATAALGSGSAMAAKKHVLYLGTSHVWSKWCNRPKHASVRL